MCVARYAVRTTQWANSKRIFFSHAGKNNVFFLKKNYNKHIVYKSYGIWYARFMRNTTGMRFIIYADVTDTNRIHVYKASCLTLYFWTVICFVFNI